MGLPASWPVLSLAHYAICRVVDPTHSFRIKGDDLIALWTDFQISHYHKLCEQVGFLVNTKKSVVSDTMGVFCEVTYRREKKTLVRCSDFSIRSFCRGEPLQPDQWLMLIRHGASLKRLHFLTRKSCRAHLAVARKLGLDPYAAPSCGGWGFPPKDLDSKVQTRTSCIVRAMHNGQFVMRDPEGASGPLVQQMIKLNFDPIRWGANGTGDPVAWSRVFGLMVGRAAFVDASHGLLVSDRKKLLQKGRRLRELALINSKLEPFPTTYRTMYDVLHRLRPMGPPPVFRGVPVPEDGSTTVISSE